MGGQDQSPAYSAYDDDEDLRSEEGEFGAADSTPSGQDSTPAGGRRLLESQACRQGTARAHRWLGSVASGGILF